jgi:hypothetical protein
MAACAAVGANVPNGSGEGVVSDVKRMAWVSG